jgi:hypothetical protein
MKIIKPGKKPEDKDYSGECHNCGCEFEFKAKEAEYISDQRDGDIYRIQCPTCKQFVFAAA